MNKQHGFEKAYEIIEDWVERKGKTKEKGRQRAMYTPLGLMGLLFLE